MKPLDQDLQNPKNTLKEFFDITIRVLEYLPNVLSDSSVKGRYIIYSSEIAGTKKFLRPLNRSLFKESKTDFIDSYEQLMLVFNRIKKGHRNFEDDDKQIIDSVIYTVQQASGVGLDLLVAPNSARKHVGNRFEELMRSVFNELAITNSKTVLNIPYGEPTDKRFYKCENDLILSPFKKVKSSTSDLSSNEIVVSIKTTSKDRMGKIFIDKILLERFIKHPQKVIGIFLNDVQRKGSDNISYTLVSNLFMVYTKFLTELEGIYYLDPPPHILEEPFKSKISRFSDLITEDIWNLFSP